jgi:choline dehydrogenase-like flavoprotein
VSFVDARELPDGHRIEADLCVVGAGAAGLAIARELAGGPIRVALLESGGLEMEPAVQALNEGHVVGHPYPPLETTHLRWFGGTTNHWTAWVRPLEPIDFEARPWVPHSGWPFGSPELAPFHERARRFLGLPERAFDLAAWEGRGGNPPWRIDGDRVETRVLQIISRQNRRLGRTQRQALEGAANVTVYLHATVLEVVPDAAARHVRHLRVTADGARRLLARARRYVLAAGGIENPRLLLASSGAEPHGLGNRHGLVGRFFANHPSAYVGTLHPMPRTLGATDTGRHATGTTHPFLALSERAQREARIPSVGFHVGALALDGDHTARARSSGPPTLADHVAAVAADVDRLVAGTPDSPGQRPPGISLQAIAEPVPDRESRVTLAPDRDRLGQRRVVLDWRVGPLVVESLRRAMEILAHEVGATARGRVHDDSGRDDLRFTTQSFHHMGTTRMHRDPAEGVVDADCRVHGIDNLHVAGSSVFPTYGTANPTFTILALALRLCDHLRARLA